MSSRNRFQTEENFVVIKNSFRIQSFPKSNPIITILRNNQKKKEENPGKLKEIIEILYFINAL